MSAGISSARFDTQLASWLQRTPRIENELQAINSAVGDGTASNSLLIFQTHKLETITNDKQPRRPTSSRVGNQFEEQNVGLLSVESMMIHLEALAIALHVTVDLFETNWSLKDICFSPTPPDSGEDGAHIDLILNHLIPCAIKTPLDCFWEGAKLLGPEQDVRMSSIGPALKWTSLNPTLMVKNQMQTHPHASFPYVTLLEWMRRVGITTGYQNKPCLDPTDPNCPLSAPNKPTKEAPNVALELKDGCFGIAANQMHWQAEELVGGIKRNKSGHIISAKALQSSIQLMSESDMYAYFRNSAKTQNMDSWSIAKAKTVLDSWQRKFQEELAQFAKDSDTARTFNIHSMTPNSFLEPIDSESISDLTNFKLTVLFMTFFTILAFPKFSSKSTSDHNDSYKNEATNQHDIVIGRIKLIILATILSAIVVLTFIASLGLSAFINLPLNMATTQILPTLALYYGFRQALTISDIYSAKFKQLHLADLTTECIDELLPIIFIETATYVVPLLVATAIPIPAMRIFIFQALTYIGLACFTTILLIPSLLTSFLIYHSPLKDLTESYTIYKTHTSAGASRISIKSKRGCDDRVSLEDNILSRIQEDLKNIKADTRRPTDINFSARLGADGLKTSLKFTSSHNSRNEFASDRQDNLIINQQTADTRNLHVTQELPDLLQWPIQDELSEEKHEIAQESSICEQNSKRKEDDNPKLYNSLFSILLKHITTTGSAKSIICLLKLTFFLAIVSYVTEIKYGLQLRTIVIRGTQEYESFLVQEKFFPIYNIFAVTKGNFDYPKNQNLLYEFHSTIQQVNGIVRDDKIQPKFWLFHFRDWLIEVQSKFDADRNQSLISNSGWTQEASDTSKLAYKLLAQTGKADNPIDKNQVETNRLVDQNGIINQRAFYYYLTAWVMNDPFSYSTSEANFRPEPKVWTYDTEDLRIERARPLTYSQIPFLLKLETTGDCIDTITKIRNISKSFEQRNFPNFPTGVPFLFWDQFINLDLIFLASIMLIIGLLFLLLGFTLTNFSTAAIVTLLTSVNLLEMSGAIGFLSIPFNSVVMVLVMFNTGTTAVQTVNYITVSISSPA